MNLKEEIIRLLFQPAHINHKNVVPDSITITKEGIDHYADQIISLILNKLPEKRSQDIDYGCQDCGNWQGFNEALDKFRSILEGK